jgi:hypothetical protein
MLGAIIHSFLYPRRDYTPYVYLSTSSFFSKHFESLLDLPNPRTAIHHYAIESISLLNNALTPQREHLCVEVSEPNKQHASPDTRLTRICIKTSASNEYDPEYFAEHSDNRSVLYAILSAVEGSSELMLPSASPSAPSSPQPFVEPSTLGSPAASQLTLVGPNPPTSTHAFYRSVTTVTGHGNKKTCAPGQVIRQIKPKNLNLFDLALLADIVHKQDRLYSLFENQRYLYANLICDAVVALYNCEQLQDHRGATYSRDNVHIPPNDHSPKLAGQSMCIPVTDVEAVMLSVVLARFEEARTQQMDAVSV